MSTVQMRLAGTVLVFLSSSTAARRSHEGYAAGAHSKRLHVDKGDKMLAGTSQNTARVMHWNLLATDLEVDGIMRVDGGTSSEGDMAVKAGMANIFKLTKAVQEKLPESGKTTKQNPGHVLSTWLWQEHGPASYDERLDAFEVALQQCVTAIADHPDAFLEKALAGEGHPLASLRDPEKKLFGFNRKHTDLQTAFRDRRQASLKDLRDAQIRGITDVDVALLVCVALPVAELDSSLFAVDFFNNFVYDWEDLEAEPLATWYPKAVQVYRESLRALYGDPASPGAADFVAYVSLAYHAQKNPRKNEEMMAVIARYQPDILTLVEVSPDQYGTIASSPGFSKYSFATLTSEDHKKLWYQQRAQGSKYGKKLAAYNNVTCPYFEKKVGPGKAGTAILFDSSKFTSVREPYYQGSLLVLELQERMSGKSLVVLAGHFPSREHSLAGEHAAQDIAALTEAVRMARGAGKFVIAGLDMNEDLLKRAMLVPEDKADIQRQISELPLKRWDEPYTKDQYADPTNDNLYGQYPVTVSRTRILYSQQIRKWGVCQFENIDFLGAAAPGESNDPGEIQIQLVNGASTENPRADQIPFLKHQVYKRKSEEFGTLDDVLHMLIPREGNPSDHFPVVADITY